MGVEEEFLVVGSDGRLSLRGPDIVTTAHVRSGEVQHELAQCQVECATGVCENAEQALRELRDLRGGLARAAAAMDTRVLASATPVLHDDALSRDATSLITPKSRYQRMAEQFGALTRTSSTCGCHVHIAIPDAETGIGVSNRVRPWLPLFLALTANSPYDLGHDTGYLSWRYILWSRWPSSGPPPLFTSVDHYEDSVAGLLRSGSILDRGMIYWDIRLSENNPTLEFRVSDVAPTPELAAACAALIRALVFTVLDSPFRAPSVIGTDVLRANLWRAARDGMVVDPETGDVRPALDSARALATRLRPVLAELGDADLVEAVLADPRPTQREVFAAAAERGRERDDALVDVVDAFTLDAGPDTPALHVDAPAVPGFAAEADAADDAEVARTPR